MIDRDQLAEFLGEVMCKTLDIQSEIDSSKQDIIKAVETLKGAEAEKDKLYKMADKLFKEIGGYNDVI